MYSSDIGHDAGAAHFIDLVYAPRALPIDPKAVVLE
jgi:hypothetical protein